jgi:hypothetical protein
VAKRLPLGLGKWSSVRLALGNSGQQRPGPLAISTEGLRLSAQSEDQSLNWTIEVALRREEGVYALLVSELPILSIYLSIYVSIYLSMFLCYLSQ